MSNVAVHIYGQTIDSEINVIETTGNLLKYICVYIYVCVCVCVIKNPTTLHMQKNCPY